MSEPLPTGEFEWIEDAKNIHAEDILNWEDDGEYGYMIECDLNYPEHLHDSHNDYPFLPENININGVHKFIPHLNTRKNIYTSL